METLSGFDTVENWIFNAFCIFSFLWVLFVLGSYTKESLSWYLTKDAPESDRAPSPNHVNHALGVAILLALWGMAIVLSSLHSSGLQNKYDFAQKLTENSEVVGKPLHPDVRLLTEAWPKIVESYKTSGEPGTYETVFDSFNKAKNYSFVDPKDYVAIKTFIKKCFVPNENLDKLQEVLSIYPASQEAFVDAWIRASLRNDYSTDRKCSPNHVFIMTGISKHVYNN